MQNYICIIIILGVALNSFASSFIPLTIKKQTKEAEIILVGDVINIESMEVGEGEFESKAVLLANKWMGFQPSDDRVVEVYYPGGVIGDRVHKVIGSPEFKAGESVVLMLKNDNGKFRVMNLGLGKFSLKKFGNKTVLINQIFPNYPDVSQMGIDQFFALAEWVKKEKFIERYKDKYELQKESQVNTVYKNRGRGRSIASAERESRKVSAYWLAFILGCIALFAHIIRKKIHDR